ncbi:hypothetical protein Deipe_1004 [Deinococcus peraridilitoris DSM 19664]|uniref:Uncharacterized protein n=2 Tax=Deinococcus TaxID=1298 RepID=K9ZY26_DEIPD|nr:hypothetical protein Deipe_1004 [Deinococcus peraridilitoris DSM 19664]
MLAGALLPWVVWVVLLATFVLFASTTSRALLDERPTARFREFRGVAVGP